ncbi:hypothetical protein L596_026616 [Steinernema carpocapsae]|uniref:G-protein coupled receptors family 1 profile domain-containing protein n=1 Tax=Steinernema carpocapsae TaxID=34508 RepID=A0A4U5M215_STECR|nr:hypothetical protein L596_026616 [Steinernema carpocapsae]
MDFLADSHALINASSLRLACHIVSGIDLILEIYFLYLVLNKSTPEMQVYRIFLIVGSLSNVFVSSVVGVVAAYVPVLEQLSHGVYVCFVSKYLYGTWSVVAYVVYSVFMLLQLQIPLAMLFYATAVVCWPKVYEFYMTPKMIPLIVGFCILPSCILLPLALRTQVEMCFWFDAHLPALTFLGALVGYGICFTIAAVFLLTMLITFLKNTRANLSKATIRLVKTIVYNFSISIGTLLIMYIGPLIFLTFFLVLGDAGDLEYKQLGLSILFLNLCYYSSVGTIVNIAITKPYRRAFMRQVRFVTMKISPTQTLSTST